METKYVIIMHNSENHSYEESPLLDSYPKAETIEYYLRQGKYAFAKVEKRYSLGNIEAMHAELNQKKTFYEIMYLNEDGTPGLFGSYNLDEAHGFVNKLKEQRTPYATTLKGENV